MKIQAFNKLKQLIINDFILICPDEKRLKLTTDAITFALGGVLSQDNKPISYITMVQLKNKYKL